MTKASKAMKAKVREALDVDSYLDNKLSEQNKIGYSATLNAITIRPALSNWRLTCAQEIMNDLRRNGIEFKYAFRSAPYDGGRNTNSGPTAGVTLIEIPVSQTSEAPVISKAR